MLGAWPTRTSRARAAEGASVRVRTSQTPRAVRECCALTAEVETTSLVSNGNPFTVTVSEPEPIYPPVKVILRHPQNHPWHLTEADAFELYDALGKILAERTRPDGL